MNRLLELLRNAPGRVRRSFGYSFSAFRATFSGEESFRLELLGLAVEILCLVFSPWPLWKCLALVACFQLILLAEVFNSAIEAVCNGITREHRQFIKNAKDMGALAVLFAIVFNALALAALWAL